MEFWLGVPIVFQADAPLFLAFPASLPTVGSEIRVLGTAEMPGE